MSEKETKQDKEDREFVETLQKTMVLILSHSNNHVSDKAKKSEKETKGVVT